MGVRDARTGEPISENLPGAVIVGAIATVLVLVTLVTPWWTSSFGPAENSAQPFDDAEGMVDTWKVVVAGLLVLAAAGAFTIATWQVYVATTNGDPTPHTALPFALAGTAIALIAALFAVFSWPPEGVSFWDSMSTGGFSGSFAADLGWYLLVATVALGGFQTWMLSRDRPVQEQPSEPTAEGT